MSYISSEFSEINFMKTLFKNILTISNETVTIFIKNKFDPVLNLLLKFEN